MLVVLFSEKATIVAIDEALVEMLAAWGKLMPDKEGATEDEKAANAAEKIKVRNTHIHTERERESLFA